MGFLLPSSSCLLKLPNIGSKSAEFVVGSDSIVTLTHSEGQLTSLRLKGSQLQKQEQKMLCYKIYYSLLKDNQDELMDIIVTKEIGFQIKKVNMI